MAKPQIKYKTQLRSLTKGGKPCYIIRVANSSRNFIIYTILFPLMS